MPNLRCLELANSKLTDAGMEGLAGLTQLEVLGIEFTDVGDEGLEHLTCLTKLQILGLNNWRTTLPDESSCNRAFRKHSSNDRARRLGRGTALRRELSFPRRMRRWAATHCWLVATAAALLGASLLAGAVALALRPSYAVRQFRSGLAYIEQGRDDLAIHCQRLSTRPELHLRRWGIVFSAAAVQRKIRWRYCPAEA